jgi:subtilisin-like proprotein convertase family protein
MRRMTFIGILVLALCTALALTLGGTAEAKKKKKHKSATVFTQSIAVNAAVPDVPPAGPSTPVRSTITVPKKFKGKVVGDLNILGIQTTGNATGAAADLRMKLTAPNGRTIYVLGSNSPTRGIGDVSIGPLTIDSDSPISICDQANPANCGDPAQRLNRPFAGTANELGLGNQSTGGINAMNGVSMRGTWTFTVFDQHDIGQTSVFNGWGLQITAAKPVT